MSKSGSLTFLLSLLMRESSASSSVPAERVSSVGGAGRIPSSSSSEASDSMTGAILRFFGGGDGVQETSRASVDGGGA